MSEARFSWRGAARIGPAWAAFQGAAGDNALHSHHAIAPGADIAAPQEPTDESQELRLAALDAAIASLPASLKEPLVLTLLEGLSHKDAATLLGVTPKAVETRVYRAKALLARALAS
jgi:RNA polymerase sigma-70 factor (ECF subfamily)